MKRLYEKVLKNHFKTENKMAFIVGPRQVGKTTTSVSALTNAVYLNWDNLEHRQIILKGPSAIYETTTQNTLQKTKPMLIVDEIHKYPKWKTFLKGFYDTYAKEINICVTGSARLDVYKYGGDSLMGRYFIYRMHPLSVREIISPGISIKEINSPGKISMKKFNTLLNFGGFPEPFLRADRRFYNRWKRLRLDLLFNEDLRDFSHITDIGRIRVLAERLINASSNTINYSNLAKDIQVSVDTIRRWLDILESIYFCYRIRPYSKNIARSILKEPKVYLWDWSLNKEKGARNENFIASHLLKMIHFYNDLGVGDYELFYLRDKNKREVDFCITRNSTPWFLVEVKSSDRNISESLYFFQEQTNAEFAFQVTFDIPYIEANCWKNHKPLKVPATTFLSQLV